MRWIRQNKRVASKISLTLRGAKPTIRANGVRSICERRKEMEAASLVLGDGVLAHPTSVSYGDEWSAEGPVRADRPMRRANVLVKERMDEE